MRHEHAFIRSTDEQRQNFRRIFMRKAEDFCFDKCTTPVQDLHAIRSELKKLAGNLMDISEKEKRVLTRQESDAVDVATYLIGDIHNEFEERAHRADAERALMGLHGVGNNATVEMMQETRTGRNIPVLGKEHRFQDFVRPDSGQVTARDYFAGLVGHVKNPEVRAALSTTSDTAGGYMVPEHISAEVIDLFRAKNTAIAAGAKSFPMSEASVRICRLVQDPTAAWVAENNLIPEDTAMEIGALEFHAKKLTTLIKVSVELLQDATNAGGVVQNAIAAAFAQELDRAVYFGTGTLDPAGIMNHPDICSLALGTGAGDKLSGYDDLLYGTREIVAANGPIPTAAVMSPRTLIDYSLMKDGDGKPLVKPDLIKGLQFFDTTKFPNDEHVGASTDCSSILLGTFSNLVIGIRANLQIQVLQERFADYGQVGFLATMRADCAVFQPKSFCKITGIKPTP